MIYGQQAGTGGDSEAVVDHQQVLYQGSGGVAVIQKRLIIIRALAGSGVSFFLETSPNSYQFQASEIGAILVTICEKNTRQG